MTHHALLVNPQGLLEVLNSDLSIDLHSYLVGDGTRKMIDLTVRVDQDPPVVVTYLLDNTARPNRRARDILARLAGVHVYLTGSVGFTGLTVARVMDLIAEVG